MTKFKFSIGLLPAILGYAAAAAVIAFAIAMCLPRAAHADDLFNTPSMTCTPHRGFFGQSDGVDCTGTAPAPFLIQFSGFHNQMWCGTGDDPARIDHCKGTGAAELKIIPVAQPGLQPGADAVHFFPPGTPGKLDMALRCAVDKSGVTAKCQIAIDGEADK